MLKSPLVTDGSRAWVPLSEALLVAYLMDLVIGVVVCKREIRIACYSEECGQGSLQSRCRILERTIWYREDGAGRKNNQIIIYLRCSHTFALDFYIEFTLPPRGSLIHAFQIHGFLHPIMVCMSQDDPILR